MTLNETTEIMNTSRDNWTGERLETFVYNETAIEHLHRYAICMDIAKAKSILDIACGEGYGSHLLAENATSVTGVDISAETIKKAQSKYKRSNLRFLEGSVEKIPATDHSFDLIVSFETIEHIYDHDKMLTEIKRVLKPGGILIISTPDKENYSDKPNYANKFHVKELYEIEFRKLISKYFSHSIFAYQKADFFSLIVPENYKGEFAVYGGNYEQVKMNHPLNPVYLLSIASDNPVDFISISIYNDRGIYKSIRQDIMAAFRKSRSYRIGNFILQPVIFLKRMFR